MPRITLREVRQTEKDESCPVSLIYWNLTKLNSESRVSLVAHTVKNLPAMWETWLQSLGWEDPLEEEMTIHSSILAWMALRSQGNWRWEGPLGTPLGLVHWTRASSPVEAGTAGYL